MIMVKEDKARERNLKRLVTKLSRVKVGRVVAIDYPRSVRLMAWSTETYNYVENKKSPCSECDVMLLRLAGKKENCPIRDCCMAHKRKDRECVVFKMMRE